MQNTKPFLATALVLSLAACGGGGSGGFVPAPAPSSSAQAPAPAPAPAPAVVAPPPAVPEVVTPKTWKDADCTGPLPVEIAAPKGTTIMPKCGIDFSANNANVTVMMEGGLIPAIQLQTIAAPLADTPSPINGKKGHKAMFGLTFLHKVKLSEYPGISFDMKLNTPARGDTTKPGDAYVTTAVSLTCDGANWMNLFTRIAEMQPVAGFNDYARYSAKINEVKWYRTGTVDFPPAPATPIINGSQGTGGAVALDQLIAAYPDACIYNWPHPTTTITPAVQLILGDSDTVDNKKAWIKDIRIGDKSIF